MQGAHYPRARWSARASLSAAVLCLLVAVAAHPRTAVAAPSGALSMSPPNNSLDIGDDVSITLDLSAVTHVHEVHLAVTYDPAIVQVVDAEPGGTVQILPGVFPGDGTTGSVLQNVVSSGIINYQYALNGSNENSGGGTIATVQFHAIANGNANIAWTTRTLLDASAVTSTPNASAAVLVVGIALPPTATNTPAPSATFAPPTSTAIPNTATSVASASATRTASATSAPVTHTPVATATPRITVVQNSNVGTSTPPRGAPPQSGVDPAQSSRANGLPSAGNDGPGIQWWKWTFFAAALMLAAAGWFFTFALHVGDKEIVLSDRFDRRRRRRY